MGFNLFQDRTVTCCSFLLSILAPIPHDLLQGGLHLLHVRHGGVQLCLDFVGIMLDILKESGHIRGDQLDDFIVVLHAGSDVRQVGTVGGEQALVMLRQGGYVGLCGSQPSQGMGPAQRFE